MKLRVKLDFGGGREPMEVGVLSEAGRELAFEFAETFLASGLDLAPFRLPRRPGPTVFAHHPGLETFGLFEDSLPDGWGRMIMDRVFQSRHGRKPTVLELLAGVGANGRGALTYEPADEELVESAGEFDLARLAESAMEESASAEALARLAKAGGSSGGARPKAYVGYDPATERFCAERRDLPPGFEHWLVKFNTRLDGADAGEREFAYYRMAIAAGANMEPCRLVETSVGRFFMTRRFDRTRDGGRLHMASAAGLLHADFRIPGEDYALLFRLADALTRDYGVKTELFRRAALNVLGHNRDDHLRNFSFLMDAQGKWTLAPFYDFTWAEGPNGWQTLSVAGEGRNPGIADLERLAARVGLEGKVAKAIIDRCSASVALQHPAPTPQLRDSP